MHTIRRGKRPAQTLVGNLRLEELEERVTLSSTAVWIDPGGSNWQTSMGTPLPSPNNLEPVSNVTSTAPFFIPGGTLDISVASPSPLLLDGQQPVNVTSDMAQLNQSNTTDGVFAYAAGSAFAPALFLKVGAAPAPGSTSATTVYAGPAGGTLAPAPPMQIGGGLLPAGVMNPGTPMPDITAGPLLYGGHTFVPLPTDGIYQLGGDGHYLVVAPLNGAAHAPSGFVPGFGQTFPVMLEGADTGPFADLGDGIFFFGDVYVPRDVRPVGQPRGPFVDHGIDRVPVVATSIPAPAPAAAPQANDLLDSLARLTLPASPQVPTRSPTTIQSTALTGIGQGNHAEAIQSPSLLRTLLRTAGNDTVGDELVERAVDKLQAALDDIDLRLTTDALSGADIAGALLTGATARANLTLQKGSQVALVATLLTTRSPSQAPAGSAGDPQRRDLLIGLLDNRVPPYPAAVQGADEATSETNLATLPMAEDTGDRLPPENEQGTSGTLGWLVKASAAVAAAVQAAALLMDSARKRDRGCRQS